MNIITFTASVLIATCTVSLASSVPVTEFRIKIGESLNKLKYPSKVGQIIDLETETVIKTAIDINPSVKPNLFQLALVPKNGEISPITFDMEYKAASSKANLNIDLKKLKPETVILGSEYELLAVVSGSSMEKLEWNIGTLRMPSKIDYQIPDIEDHFYILPEIYSPEPEKIEGKRNPVYPIVGLIAITLPWIIFIRLWKGTGALLTVPRFLLNNSTSIYYPLFTVSIVGLFILTVFAWIYLSIFQTLGFLAILSSTAFVFGYKSFKDTVSQEEKKLSAKNSKAD